MGSNAWVQSPGPESPPPSFARQARLWGAPAPIIGQNCFFSIVSPLLGPQSNERVLGPNVARHAEDEEVWILHKLVN